MIKFTMKRQITSNICEMAVFGAMVLVLLLGIAAGQDANCDYTQNVQLGQTYYISSPGYPSNYSGPRQCRWIAIAPSGYLLRMECPEINLPQSSGCSMDRLLISRSGDPQLNGADVYCGRGSTTALSTGPRMSLGLITSSSTTGGRFYCQLRAEQATPTPTCSCGYKKTNRIVGGQETGVNEYPMMAGVIYLDQEKIRCGSTIISQRYVVTAAHCVANRAANSLAVVVGEHDITTGDSPATQGFNVASVVIHPQYNPSNNDYDIAILKLTRDIVFSNLVGPVCLPFKFANTDFTGARFTLLGWGTEFFGGPTSNVLKKVDVNVISRSSCQQTVPSLTARQFCTYTPGKDSCQDDSGGPALYTEPSSSLLYLVGCISYGRSCAENGQPGVNTQVTAFLTWIKANTADASYCMK